MNLAYINRNSLLEEVFAPVKDVDRNWLLRAAALQRIEIESRPDLIAEIKLLVDSKIYAGTHQEAHGASTCAAIVGPPRSRKIHPVS